MNTHCAALMQVASDAASRKLQQMQGDVAELQQRLQAMEAAAADVVDAEEEAEALLCCHP